jgi:hypothetical protein
MIKKRTLRFLAFAVALIAVAGPAMAASEDPDWPCIQGKVPEISAGMVWAGPPIDDLADAPQRDEQVKALASRISARRLAIEEAQREIDTFAASLGADKDQKLTLLFAVTLDVINRERASIISGIQRYARRQAQLAERIQTLTAELNRIPLEGSEEDQARRRELEERQVWDTRIFEERSRSLTYICDQPVILEQRLFALSRQMMSHLE